MTFFGMVQNVMFEPRPKKCNFEVLAVFGSEITFFSKLRFFFVVTVLQEGGHRGRRPRAGRFGEHDHLVL
jgi:hypothetical protein